MSMDWVFGLSLFVVLGLPCLIAILVLFMGEEEE